MITELKPIELKEFLAQHPDTILLDVREDEELAICQLSGCVHIPMNLVPLHQSELPDEVPIVVYCHHGIRSLNVARFLEHAGFEELYNLRGGIDAWAQEVEPEMKRY
ncbi:rhodanese-like domain-containing protein [Kingella negevensis]|uniref:rhodanese-like domain-containing protein n=1 Tax=Kingella negevensis TaxID=1522312 RepID=UPI0009E04178